jgi:anti-anti-sigma regulatory factor
MLKVTVLNGGAECIRKVEGRLFSPWVPELESAWEEAQQAASGKKVTVDLSGTAFIDSNQKVILTNTIAHGAKLVARRIYNRHIVEELKSTARAAGAARNAC